jgi:hypothetical protein
MAEGSPMTRMTLAIMTTLLASLPADAQDIRLGAARMNAKLMAQSYFCPDADKNKIMSWIEKIESKWSKDEGNDSFKQLTKAEFYKLDSPISQVGFRVWCDQQRKADFYREFFKVR